MHAILQRPQQSLDPVAPCSLEEQLVNVIESHTPLLMITLPVYRSVRPVDSHHQATASKGLPASCRQAADWLSAASLTDGRKNAAYTRRSQLAMGRMLASC